MVQQKRKVGARMLSVLVGVYTGLQIVRQCVSIEKVTVVLHHELKENRGYAEFTIVGQNGDFRAELILPDGETAQPDFCFRDDHKTPEARWFNRFVIENAESGLYTFEIKVRRLTGYKLETRFWDKQKQGNRINEVRYFR
ncbi:hypothetical protein [Paenibacillus sp. HB172176]|uniref:hypothetical protein n=1 Tax=Paenibacillus sp. HB172176 TaxID=2493690 RepID=UPI00143A9ECC|nr:hypothetical protein [Paenibacillus sp. HB172176]